jgi:hypothetical protein
MSRLVLMATIAAWPIALFCTLVCITGAISAYRYPGSLEEALDKCKGIRTEYRPGKPAVLALLAWAWIITGWIL